MGKPKAKKTGDTPKEPPKTRRIDPPIEDEAKIGEALPDGRTRTGIECEIGTENTLEVGEPSLSPEEQRKTDITFHVEALEALGVTIDRNAIPELRPPKRCGRPHQ